MQRTTFLLAPALLFVASQAYAGAIKGAVSTTKTAKATAIDMSADPKCKKMSPDAKTDDTIINGGKVKNVFVYLKNPPKKKYKAPANAKLDQIGCMYVPKVIGLMEGQNVDIINSDATLHNVHAYAKRGEFNQAMPKQGQKITKSFKKAQVMIPIKCDVHPWMASYAGVVEHPFFAVTGDAGDFSIDTTDLADGEYEVSIWHEKLGEKAGKVTVAGGNGALDLSL